MMDRVVIDWVALGTGALSWAGIEGGRLLIGATDG